MLAIHAHEALETHQIEKRCNEFGIRGGDRFDLFCLAFLIVEVDFLAGDGIRLGSA